MGLAPQYRWVLLILGPLVAVLAVIVVVAETTVGRPPVAATSGETVEPGVPQSPFGVEQTGWTTSNSSTVATEIAKTGAMWTRINYLSWQRVQASEAGAYDWTAYDQILSAPAEKSLLPIVVISDAPEWATYSSVHSGPIASEHVADFARFVQAAVARYSQPPYGVKYWEMYNEPDGTWSVYDPVVGTWGNPRG